MLILKGRSFLNALLVLSVFILTSNTVIAQSDLYNKGQNHIDEKQWKAAERSFKKSIKNKEQQSDAAYYWLAYVNVKNGENLKAIKSIEKLRKLFPSSTWINDAEALEIEIKTGTNNNTQVEDIEDEELKLYAISALMHSSSDKSIEILERLLRGNSSEKLKERALFVLSQMAHPQGFNLIIEIATGKGSFNGKTQSDIQLREQAILMLGVSGANSASEILAEIYKNSDNSATKNRVLHSIMMSDQPGALKEIILSEKNTKLKNQGIHMLGVMGQTKTLSEFYYNSKFENHKEAIIQGLVISNGTEQLIDIMKSTKDPKEQLWVLQQPTVFTDERSGPFLYSLYNKTNDVEMKQKIIQRFFVQQNATHLIKIYKEEGNQELKRHALKIMSMMRSDETLEIFETILDQE